MAIPETPLEVKIEIDELTLDELVLFEDGGFSALGFRQFLIDHTNWQAAEIGKLKVGELKHVAEQVGEAVQRAAVPLES